MSAVRAFAYAAAESAAKRWRATAHTIAGVIERRHSKGWM
jgi:hypothetical protein